MQSIILLVVSVMLVIVSSWNLSIFVQLKEKYSHYKTKDVINNICNMSKKYIKFGEIISIIILIISIILLIGSSANIYYTYKN